jgi:hypothetical protein
MNKPYSRFIVDSKRTPKGKHKLPMEVVNRLKLIAALEKRIEAMEWFVKYQDHSIPYSLPIGEFKWHEARKEGK